MPVRRLTPALLLALVLTAAAGADDLSTVAGKKLAGTLVAVDKDGVTFRAGAADTKVSAKEILAVDFGRPVAAPPKDAKYSELQLTDGSAFRVGKFLLKGKAFEVELLPGPAGVPPPAFELPLGAVAHVLRGAEDPKLKADWRKLLAARGKRDLYVIRQADGLNFVPGTVVGGSPDGTTVKFEKEGGTAEDLRLSRATGGLVFAPPPPAAVPPTLCKVVDVFGNVLTARAVEMAGSGITVTTVAGVTVRYPAAAGVAKLDYAQGNVAYLSDFAAQVDAPPPPEAEEKAFALLKGAAGPPPYVRDRLPTEAAILLDGVSYPKGVGLAADTVVTYPLGGDYREFKALVGFADARHANAAELRLTVEADGRVLATETVRGSDKPKPLTLDVKGVQTLRLLVEGSAPPGASTTLILADARVLK
ncbi:MAG: NPCBM/NEW2 domain-containing protein [Gemmataceae bacterium]|nr:NPCBM/NEW2 domain-containing protein [Gemmataceae bacterium]